MHSEVEKSHLLSVKITILLGNCKRNVKEFWTGPLWQPWVRAASGNTICDQIRDWTLNPLLPGKCSTSWATSPTFVVILQVILIIHSSFRTIVYLEISTNMFGNVRHGFRLIIITYNNYICSNYMVCTPDHYILYSNNHEIWTMMTI